jgi:hypothetical protein
MSITNPVNLAPALADQTSVLKADVAAALSELLTEHTTGQTALASSLTDILAKVALESDQNETLINALSTVSGEIDTSVQSIQNSFIGETKALNVNDNFGLFQSGTEHWLKTGVIETDTASYPDAKITTTVAGTYKDVSHYIGRNAGITGGTWDGQNFWLVGTTSDTVNEYGIDGLWTGNTFDVSAECGFPSDIIWDGTDFYVLDGSPTNVYKYNAAGVYSGESFPISEDTSPRGITFDGTHLWIAGNANDSVYKYTMAGVYTGTSFSLEASHYNPHGIVWDGFNFWISDSSSDSAYKYSAGGVYSGISFAISEDTTPNGIFHDGVFLWVAGDGANRIYKYSGDAVYIGTATRGTDPLTDLPIYERIL